MIKVAVSAALAVSLLAAPWAIEPAMATDKPQPMGWLSLTLRSVVVFHSCTERLKERFNIGPLNDISITDMDTGGGDLSGAVDVKFAATTTEKKTQRRSHFVGVCHIGREGETRIEARLVSQDGGNVIRRVPPGRIAG